MPKLSLTEYKIHADTSAPLSFAFVSDLHCREYGDILDAIIRRSPDCILSGGDFIDSGDDYNIGLLFLAECAKKYPTFASLGNHEAKYGGDIRRLVRETGAVLLDNSAAAFRGITIGGLTSGFRHETVQRHLMETPAPDLNWLARFASHGGYKILLSHHPEYYEKYLRALSIDLILSGHAHGGQWRFFGRGLFAPGQGILPKYTSGIHDSKLIVSRGLGNKCGFPRIFNNPELIFINIAP